MMTKQTDCPLVPVFGEAGMAGHLLRSARGIVAYDRNDKIIGMFASVNAWHGGIARSRAQHSDNGKIKEALPWPHLTSEGAPDSEAGPRSAMADVTKRIGGTLLLGSRLPVIISARYSCAALSGRA